MSRSILYFSDVVILETDVYNVRAKCCFIKKFPDKSFEDIEQVRAAAYEFIVVARFGPASKNDDRAEIHT